jgi:GntR family transcriptional regulator, rspAB operon transcriptional repressor
MAAGNGDSHRPTRADDVYRTIKADIVSLKLKPGSMVQEETLAQQLGVSRTPVREALRRLGQEGLVYTAPKKGTLIAPVSIDDIREVFQLRLALEPLAARLATPHIPQEEIDSLRSHHVPPAQGASGLILDYRDLHLSIRRHCGNRRLESILEQLIVDTHRVLSLSNQQYLLQSLEHHLKVLDAFQSRDADAAEAAMREHILRSQQLLVSNLITV